jgi:hypothetical protein
MRHVKTLLYTICNELKCIPAQFPHGVTLACHFQKAFSMAAYLCTLGPHGPTRGQQLLTVFQHLLAAKIEPGHPPTASNIQTAARRALTTYTCRRILRSEDQLAWMTESMKTLSCPRGALAPGGLTGPIGEIRRYTACKATGSASGQGRTSKVQDSERAWQWVAQEQESRDT